MQTVCTWLQTDNHTNTSSLSFIGHDSWCPTNSVKSLKTRVSRVNSNSQVFVLKDSMGNVLWCALCCVLLITGGSTEGICRARNTGWLQSIFLWEMCLQVWCTQGSFLFSMLFVTVVLTSKVGYWHQRTGTEIACFFPQVCCSRSRKDEANGWFFWLFSVL